MADASERAGAYFAHDAASDGETDRLGTWHEVGEIDPVEFVPGLLMRPVVGDGVMVNFVTYEPGTVVPMHAHEEEQVTFVLEGEFEFEMNGETRTVRPGMAAHIPPNVPHAARTLDTSCSQVDVFAPPRKVLLEALRARTA
jgi:quercetin dioxygenase-like cupin family protein